MHRMSRAVVAEVSPLRAMPSTFAFQLAASAACGAALVAGLWFASLPLARLVG